MKTKNSIFMSLVSLTLCVAMLLGSTFAWFTDMAASNDNVVAAGTLDVQMFWSEELLDADSTEWKNVEDDANRTVFNYNNWEPGYTEVRYVKVYNNGDLNLKWRLTIEANGAVSELGDVIDVYYVNPVTAELTALDGLTKAGSLTKVMAEKTCSTGSLVPEQEVILAIALNMDKDAGNNYQGMSLCDEGFSLKLVAAQETGEMGAFGDDYDAEAEWEDVNYSASAAISASDLTYGALSNSVTIGGGEISAELPAAVKVAEGATSLELSVTNVANDANLSLGEGESARSLDVHISGISEDNTVPMIVNLGKVMNPGIADTELKLYHIENGTPVLMTRVASAADFAIHNQYTYNAATGEVSIYVASFSVFSLLQTNVSVWDGVSADTAWYTDAATEFTLMTAAELAGFRDLVDGGNTFEGKTVKLGTDIDLNNILFDPIGYGYADNGGKAFMGTFDGQNHVIYNLYENGWELNEATETENYTYSTAGAGLFASIKNATVKNLAISGAEIVFECVDMGTVVGYAQGTCNFENILVANTKLANYQRYTGGVVGEVCYDPYNSIEAYLTEGEFSHVFENVTVDSTVKLSSLWGDFDNANGGVIGGKWGEAKVKMTDVAVACELDVFSDVTAAYQWYAYRRCGMLIGHTEINSPKLGIRLTQEDVSFLTCENVSVYYGDWVNYTYYEFANQDSATGQRYPWVRLEAGERNSALSNPRYGVPTYDGDKVIDGSDATDSAEITFNQLYGGGQGVYGCAVHTGVTAYNTVSNEKTVTVYIENSRDWQNLRLTYAFGKDDGNGGVETWTTVSPEGISMVGMYDAAAEIYRVELPLHAYSVTILADGTTADLATDAKLISELEDGTVYNLGWNHVHTCTDDNGVDRCTTCWAKVYSETVTVSNSVPADKVNTMFNSDVCIDSKYTEGTTTNDEGTTTTTYTYTNYVLGNKEGVVRIEVDKGTATACRDVVGENPRIYKGNTVTFSAGEGKLITRVEIQVRGTLMESEPISDFVANLGVWNLNSNITGGFFAPENAYIVWNVAVGESNPKLIFELKTPAESFTFTAPNQFCYGSFTVDYEEPHVCKAVTDEAVAPSCYTTGLTEGSHCGECGKVFVAQTVVPATHTWVAATESTPKYCSICKIQEYTEVTSNRDPVDESGNEIDEAGTEASPDCLEYSTDKVVWKTNLGAEGECVTVTVEKHEGQYVPQHAGPARFGAGNLVTVFAGEGNLITKVTIKLAGQIVIRDGVEYDIGDILPDGTAAYPTEHPGDRGVKRLDNAISSGNFNLGEGVTIIWEPRITNEAGTLETVANPKLTITFDEPVESFSFVSPCTFCFSNVTTTYLSQPEETVEPEESTESAE